MLRLVAACVLQFAASGPQFSSPVLYGAIAASFGEEQAHVTALMPAAFAAGTFVMAVPGSLFMERFGFHRSFLVGCIGICLCTIAQVLSTGLMSLTALHGAIGIFKAFSGDVAFVAFCTSWFHDKTATAIAICFAAVGAGASLWTLIAANLAGTLGWRAALALSAAVQCTVSLPLAICCMRDPPPGRLARQPSHFARDTSFEVESAGTPWWLTDPSVWLLLLLNISVVFTSVSTRWSSNTARQMYKYE
jgi:MFS family permease